MASVSWEYVVNAPSVSAEVCSEVMGMCPGAFDGNYDDKASL